MRGWPAVRAASEADARLGVCVAPVRIHAFEVSRAQGGKGGGHSMYYSMLTALGPTLVGGSAETFLAPWDSDNDPRVSGQAVRPAPEGPRGLSPSVRYTR